jgi:hypothetical protein
MAVKTRIAAALAVTALVLGSQVVLADDHKHPNDKCPPGTHTTTVEKSTTAEAKPGGVGLGSTVTEKREVCRDNKDAGVKERGGKGRDR